MRIQRRPINSEKVANLRQDLTILVEAYDQKDAPCAAKCPRAVPGNCSRNCRDAAWALSSDPEESPLEQKIVPLVYELKNMGVFDPCWSCEGHNAADGHLWKLPRVWFYADSVVHVRILDDCISAMHNNGKLHFRWQIALTHSDPDNADTAFSLEPTLDAEDKPDLADLQQDAKNIADQIGSIIQPRALKFRNSF